MGPPYPLQESMSHVTHTAVSVAVRSYLGPRESDELGGALPATSMPSKMLEAATSMPSKMLEAGKVVEIIKSFIDRGYKSYQKRFQNVLRKELEPQRSPAEYLPIALLLHAKHRMSLASCNVDYSNSKLAPAQKLI
jgi:citrate synthase